jgi:tRNA dimethylallyltransferase
MDKSAPVLIFGPTASGKSALAMGLAERLGGVVINADSMQVYSELRILTARPSAADEARVPHLLYGHVPAREAYSTGRYIKDLAEALGDARRRGLRPILVGGTGLYFKAVLEGLSPIPEIAGDVRAHWRAEADRIGAEALHAILASDDPVMAERLEAADTQRIVRALEVFHFTGRSLADWQSVPGTPLIDPHAVHKLVLAPERAELRARADRRFLAMIDAGACDEAVALTGLDLDPSLPSMRAIGVSALIAVHRGEITDAAAITAAQAETRQYIKRQSTWLNRNMITWNKLIAQETESTLTSALSFIQSSD